ncbi:hypothetical protein F4553_006994 [Allocatelliglobosispora scoriae]|uniref:Uncharacterized protein n=1 Tax=Allocatelliglobosispora scoriae TaxID=643052 RepID=A0A841C3M4_9ACTN|nr:hypothetical protein [Allocatelliglobosispora scoriae]
MRSNMNIPGTREQSAAPPPNRDGAAADQIRPTPAPAGTVVGRIAGLSNVYA